MAKTVLVLLLALAWAPLTAHCQIETICGFDFLSCKAVEHSPAAEGSHCDQGCCAVESSSYRAQDSQPVNFLPDLTLLMTAVQAPSAKDQLVNVAVRPSIDPPPELVVSWCFLSRLALPVRAPSMAS